MNSWTAADYVGTTWIVTVDDDPIGSFIVEDFRWGAFVGTFSSDGDYLAVKPIIDAAVYVDTLGEDSEIALDVAEAMWQTLYQHIRVTGPRGEWLESAVLRFDLPEQASDEIGFATVQFPDEPAT